MSNEGITQQFKRINFLRKDQYESEDCTRNLDELWAIDTPSIIASSDLSATNNWYIAYTNGLCIQSGVYTFTTANAWKAISLNIEYLSPNYLTSVTPISSSATTTFDVLIGDEGKNTSTTLYLSCSNNAGKVRWFTIGKISLDKLPGGENT